VGEACRFGPAVTENRRGILYMVTGMAALVVNDSAVKYVGQSVGVAQMIFVRGVMAIVMLGAVARAVGATARLHTLADRTVATRVVLDCLTTFLFIVSLMHLPIGNATAINLGSPLIMALLAVFLLGEHPGFRRWLAIGAGFAGIVLVIQPRLEGFNAWSLMCLAATLFQSVRDLLTRRIPSEVPTILIALATVSFITLIAGSITLILGWQPIGRSEILLLAIAAVLLAVGYWLIINSMRHGEITVVAPFRYSGLLVALLTGFIVWGEVPTAIAWGGIALLLAAGVYLLHEERRRREDDLPSA
jgi:drug/metabolite transporter (DMT)-like permease